MDQSNHHRNVNRLLLTKTKQVNKTPIIFLKNKKNLNQNSQDSNREMKKLKFNQIEILTNQNSKYLNEKHLWMITNEYENLEEWKQLAKHLSLTEHDTQIIETKYLARDGLNECFYQCLLKWRLKQPENCTFNYLASVLSKKFQKSKNFIKKLNPRYPNTKACNLLDTYLNILNIEKIHLTGRKLNEKSLWTMSDLICEEWKPISRCLGLRESNITQIELRYVQLDGIRECCYQSLLQWLETNIQEAGLEELCLVLVEMKLNFYAKQLLELFLLRD